MFKLIALLAAYAAMATRLMSVRGVPGRGFALSTSTVRIRLAAAARHRQSLLTFLLVSLPIVVAIPFDAIPPVAASQLLGGTADRAASRYAYDSPSNLLESKAPTALNIAAPNDIRRYPAATGAPLNATRGSTALVPRTFQTLAPNGGFLGGFRQRISLSPGTVVDRFGGRGGRFTSPAGTPFSARGLPPENALLPFERFEVLKTLPTDAGIAGHAFGGGGGIQYEFLQSLQSLVDGGFLRVVP